MYYNAVTLMNLRKNHKLILGVLSLSCFIAPLAAQKEINYPYLKDHPVLDYRTQATISPFLLPLDHPMKAILDSIFSQSRVIENERTLVDAGFEIIAGPMPRSFIVVVRHPEAPGFVFKIYLDSENRCRKEVPHWLSLTRRCIGAEGIRKIIERKKIQHFSVPDKWLYLLPVYPYSSSQNPETVILMETDMELESDEVTKKKWKTEITKKHLDELYSILKHGYGGRSTISISANVPFTKQGKFAFTDTEGFQADLNLKHVKKYLSDDMKRYWDSLIKDNPK